MINTKARFHRKISKLQTPLVNSTIDVLERLTYLDFTPRALLSIYRNIKTLISCCSSRNMVGMSVANKYSPQPGSYRYVILFQPINDAPAPIPTSCNITEFPFYNQYTITLATTGKNMTSTEGEVSLINYSI